ncbi:MAG: transporter substrate-binding domain-containing protein [Myxococcota bacterium]
MRLVGKLAVAGVLGLAGLWLSTGASAEEVEKRDFPAIQKRGVIRFLIRQAEGHLPREGAPLEQDRALAQALGDRLNLRVEFVVAPSRAELIPWLQEGRGDVVAASLQITDERKKLVEFSRPIKVVRQQLVVPASEGAITSLADLKGKRIHVRKSSSFWGTLEALQAQHGPFEVVAAPEDLETEELIYQVGAGKIPATVADSDLVASVLGYNEQVKVAMDLTEEVPLAWAMRKEDGKLHEKVNGFIIENALTSFKSKKYVGDLDELKKRKVIRVITRNASTTFFLHKGEQLGFEYELTQYFAKQLGLRLEIVVPPTRGDLIRYLNEGLGDMIAASMTITPEREKDVAFSRPYNFVSELLVARSKKECPKDPADLAGRSVHVRQSSSYATSLQHLQEQGINVKVVPEDEELETETIIGRVASGEIPLTVADSNILDVELTYRDDVVSCFPLGDPQKIAWGIRKNSPQLQAAVDAFVKKEYRGLFYNIVMKRYFKDQKNVRSKLEARLKQGQLSPFDPLVKKYSAQYDLDWRLMTSQMYQESNFDPGARSWVGALGLFQVMPQTAKELGVGDVTQPEAGIHAGVKYMSQLIAQWDPGLKIKDRIRFAQASYNAGKGHVMDARRLAQELKLDPDKWFGNVEKAMLLLSQPKYARKARHGYCRGEEPVQYVSKIQTRYEAYAKIAPP